MTFRIFVYASHLPSCPVQPSVLGSCSVQRVPHAMLHKIRKIVTHKYAHTPTPPEQPSHPLPQPAHTARCMPHAAHRLPACRTPRRGATEAVSQPVAHSHKCSTGREEGKGGKGLPPTLAARSAREEDPTQLSYKSNDVVVGGGGCGPLPISGSHFSRAPQRVETGAEIN